jgi:hypothetical protein
VTFYVSFGQVVQLLGLPGSLATISRLAKCMQNDQVRGLLRLLGQMNIRTGGTPIITHAKGRAMRYNFSNLASRCAGLVAAEKNQQKCFDILSGEVNQILEGLTCDA